MIIFVNGALPLKPIKIKITLVKIYQFIFIYLISVLTIYLYS